MCRAWGKWGSDLGQFAEDLLHQICVELRVHDFIHLGELLQGDGLELPVLQGNLHKCGMVPLAGKHPQHLHEKPSDRTG